MVLETYVAQNRLKILGDRYHIFACSNLDTARVVSTSPDVGRGLILRVIVERDNAKGAA
jgi:hypothetical protein